MPARLEVVSFEVLSKLFHLPMKDVMEKLHVSAPTLKKMCRQHNIQRWPHRKLQSIEKNLKKISKFHPTSNSEKARKSAKLAKLLRKRSTIFRIPIPKEIEDEDALIKSLLEEQVHEISSLPNFDDPSSVEGGCQFSEKAHDELPSTEAAQALLGMSKDVQSLPFLPKPSSPPSPAALPQPRESESPSVVDRRAIQAPQNPIPTPIQYPRYVPFHYQAQQAPIYYQPLQYPQGAYYSPQPIAAHHLPFPVHVQRPIEHYAPYPAPIRPPRFTPMPSENPSGYNLPAKSDHSNSMNQNLTLPPLQSFLRSIGE
jgi:hypothetical protein